MGKKLRYLTADEFMKNAKPCDIGRDAKRLVEVESLLGTYSVDYVIETFNHVTRDYGYTREQLEQMAPACVESAKREVERRAGIAELMPRVFGAEGDFD